MHTTPHTSHTTLQLRVLTFLKFSESSIQGALSYCLLFLVKLVFLHYNYHHWHYLQHHRHANMALCVLCMRCIKWTPNEEIVLFHLHVSSLKLLNWFQLSFVYKMYTKPCLANLIFDSCPFNVTPTLNRTLLICSKPPDYEKHWHTVWNTDVIKRDILI
jgi:hypothetical protein